MYDLNRLENNLKAQATASSTIVLDDTVFTVAVLDGIRTAFALAEGANLTITGVSATDIPAPVGSTLTISVGTASVLNQSGVGIGLIFKAVGDSLVAIISATMSASWKFSASFEGLDLFPFKDLKTSDSRFVYASAEQTGHPWPGDPSYTIDLAAGLNFLSDVTLNNFSVISALLGALVGSDPFKFYGPLAPTDGQQLPVGTIKAPLGSGTFNIGVAPNALTLANPSVAVRIGASDTVNPLQRIDLLVEAEFNKTLEVAVGIPMSGGTMAVSTTPLPHHSSINSLIESLPGGSGFSNYIPDELSAIFANVGLDNFTMVVKSDPKVTYLALSISTLEPWPIITGALVLNGLHLQIEVVEPTGMNWTRVYIEATAKFLPDIFSGIFDFTIALQKQSKWELGTVSGRYFGSVTLAKIVQGTLGAGSSVPAVLNDIHFSDFGVTVDKTNNTYTIFGNCEFAFPMLGSALTSTVSIVVTKTPPPKTGKQVKPYTVLLHGQLVIGEEVFSFTFDLGGGDTVLTASWKTLGSYLEFRDIATAFGFDIPHIPKGLDLGLKSASFSYDFTEDTIVLEADSANYGKIVFVALKNPAQQFQYFFGLETGSTINLSNLSLIDWILPDDDSLNIQQIQVIISSDAISPTFAATINTTIGKLGIGYPQIPAAGMSAGVGFAMEVNIAGTSIPIAMGANTPSPDRDALPGGGTQSLQPLPPPPAKPAVPPPVKAADGATWFNIQKNFGPVSVEKIGLQYKNGKIFVLVNLSLTASGLTIGLVGFGVGSPITSFDPSFTIRGLDITYDQGPIEISGGLLGTLDPLSFTGELLIKGEVLTISALGGYAQVENHPSLFVYAVLDYPIGGPSFFFVTGLAAGFGFNRKLVLPNLDGVPTFPLVEWAMGGGSTPDKGTPPDTVLSQLTTSGIVAPELGQDWLAAGIRFTSFELLDSFALLIVKFGNSFEIDLLGLSTLEIPKGAPVAEAQLAIKASFSPSEGLLAIAGQLTRNSYVLSRSARLTGGFAFYLWFSGMHEGDFVVTLGGYSPKFTAPDYYPPVPRLGLNWDVGSGLTITGDLYFALTSNAVMAGGGMSAVWHGGPVKAWFDVEADFLMVFKPFQYYITAGIHIGASFTLDLLFTSVTMTIHVGVDLNVWGPPFALKAKVDLDIISFTISIGGDPAQYIPIPWDDFVSNMLPSKSTTGPKEDRTPESIASAGKKGTPDPVANADVLHINVIGLTKTATDDTGIELYVVNPKKFQVEIHSVIPSTTDPVFKDETKIKLDDSSMVDTSGKPLATPNRDFGIGPTGTAPGELTSTMHINFKAAEQGEAIKGTDHDEAIQALPIIGNVPKALWEKKNHDSHGVPVSGGDTLTSTTINNVVTGFKLIPVPPTNDHTRPIEIQYLKYTIDENLQGFAWSTPYIPTTDPFSSETVVGTIGSDAADFNRRKLLDAIPKDLLATVATIDVSHLASPADYDLLASPVNRLPGEYATG